MSDSLDKLDVARIVRRAGHMLAESLWEYWPSKGNNEMPERNISMQLAIAFHEKGFKCFSEAHWKQEGDHRKLDLLAVHPGSKDAVCIECKRLYSAEKCGSMLEDVERIRSFVPLDDGVQYTPRFGVLACSTWNNNIAEWWSTSYAAPPTNKEEWNNLIDALGEKSHWGSVPLSSYDEAAKEKQLQHHMLYIVFPIPL